MIKKSELRKMIKEVLAESPDMMMTNSEGDFLRYEAGFAFGGIETNYGHLFGITNSTHGDLVEGLIGDVFRIAYNKYEKLIQQKPNDKVVNDIWTALKLIKKDSQRKSLHWLLQNPSEDEMVIVRHLFPSATPTHRSDMTHPGRIWKKDKVISFWRREDYNPNEIKKAIQLLSKERIKIKSSDWKIDLWMFVDDNKYPGEQVVPLDQYLKHGKAMVSSAYMVTPAEMDSIIKKNKDIQHVVSPLKKSGNWSKMTKKQKKELYDYYVDKGRPSGAEKRFLYMVGSRSGSKQLQKLGESLIQKSKIRMLIREMLKEDEIPIPIPEPDPNPRPDPISPNDTLNIEDNPILNVQRAANTVNIGAIEYTGDKRVDSKVDKLQRSNMNTPDSFSGKIIAKTKAMGVNLTKQKDTIKKVSQYDDKNTKD
jgi:hypothetical protein